MQCFSSRSVRSILFIIMLYINFKSVKIYGWIINFTGNFYNLITLAEIIYFFQSAIHALRLKKLSAEKPRNLLEIFYDMGNIYIFLNVRVILSRDSRALFLSHRRARDTSYAGNKGQKSDVKWAKDAAIKLNRERNLTEETGVNFPLRVYLSLAAKGLMLYFVWIIITSMK